MKDSLLCLASKALLALASLADWIEWAARRIALAAAWKAVDLQRLHSAEWLQRQEDKADAARSGGLAVT